jgi:hypothetical protein
MGQVITMPTPIAAPMGKTIENLVCDSLCVCPRMFQNYHGDYLPTMQRSIQCQFNRSGHGFDILAVDKLNWNLWVIEISAGKSVGSGFGEYLVKALETRKRARGHVQMSPQWRRYALEGFIKSPDLTRKLAVLFNGSEEEPEALVSLLNLKFNDHCYAMVVPEGAHVEDRHASVEFASSIYTFRSSVE